MNLDFLIKGYKNKRQQILTHVVFWIFYVSLYSVLLTIPSQIGFGEIFLRSMYFLPVDIIATYLLIYFLLPTFLIKRKYLYFTFSFALLGFVILLANQFINYYLYIPKYFPKVAYKIGFWQFDYFQLIVTSLSVGIFATAFKLMKYWVNEQQQKSILEMQNLKSELSLLKYQMNPHFIFNTLNNIDSLVHTSPEKASQSIIRLSEIMRYVLYEANVDYVPLEKEVNYLKSFIALNELRFGKGIADFEVQMSDPQMLVAPMLFVPLVENAIKHGNKKIPFPAVKIVLHQENMLCFTVENTIAEENFKDKVGGIGLVNLQRRLELLYQGRYDFHTEIKDTNHYYSKLCLKQS